MTGWKQDERRGRSCSFSGVDKHQGREENQCLRSAKQEKKKIGIEKRKAMHINQTFRFFFAALFFAPIIFLEFIETVLVNSEEADTLSPFDQLCGVKRFAMTRCPCSPFFFLNALSLCFVSLPCFAFDVDVIITTSFSAQAFEKKEN